MKRNIIMAIAVIAVVGSSLAVNAKSRVSHVLFTPDSLTGACTVQQNGVIVDNNSSTTETAATTNGGACQTLHIRSVTN